MKDEVIDIRDLVIQVMNNNKIDYPVEFGLLAQRGCPNDACEDFVEEVIAQMNEYCRIGVNGGFNKDLKDALEVLARMCVQLTDMRKAKDAFKTLEKAEKTLAQIKQDTRLPDVAKTEIKALVFKYIDRSIAAIPGLEMRSPAQQEVLKQSEKKLKTLRAAIEKALDDSTPEALAIAEKIIAHIQKWRDDACVSQCNSRSLEELDAAVNESHEWNKLTVPADKKKRVTRELKYKTDDIDTIANSGIYKENMTNLGNRIRSSRAALEETYNTDSLHAEQDEFRAQVAELQRQVQETREKFHMNEIDKYEAVDTIKDLNSEINDIQSEIQSIGDEITSTESTKRKLAKAIRKVDVVCKFIARYEKDPAMYAMLCAQMEFDKLDSILSGLANPEAIDSLVWAFQTKLAANKQIAKVSDELDSSLRELENVERRAKQEEREASRNSDGLTVDEQRERQYDEDLVALGLADGPTDSGDTIDRRVRNKIGSADDDI